MADYRKHETPRSEPEAGYGRTKKSPKEAYKPEFTAQIPDVETQLGNTAKYEAAYDRQRQPGKQSENK